MKTFKITTCIVLFAIVAIFVSSSMTACSSDEESYMAPTSDATISDAHITFTYTIPEDLLKYAEITVCFKDNDGSETRWVPMSDNTFTVTYDLTQFPFTAPVVMVYETTNHPAYGKSVDWEIKMNVEASMTIDGKREIRNHTESYKINGDLGNSIDTLIKNVVDRTYTVKINKAGDIQFVK